MPLSRYIYGNCTGTPMRPSCDKLYDDIRYMFSEGKKAVPYMDSPPSWDNVVRVMEEKAWTQ